MARAFILGTRGSPLARRQAALVCALLHKRTGQTPSTTVVTAVGDDSPGTPISGFQTPGVFTSTLERALVAGQIDIAVHSLKDLPTTGGDEGLEVAAIPPRGNPADALVGPFRTLIQLPYEARVGTGSPRRSALLHLYRPDLTVVAQRGNVDTRLLAIGGQVDAVLLAAAGLGRLQTDRQFAALDPTAFVPAAGQGALAVQCRRNDDEVRRALSLIDDPASRQCAYVERDFLATLQSGCQDPVGVWVTPTPAGFRLIGVVLAPGGGLTVWVERVGMDFKTLGRHAAQMCQGL